jgi:hypothetical protein
MCPFASFNGVRFPVRIFTALENEVGIRQCRPKCRPINLPGRQIFADVNSAKVRFLWCCMIAVKKSAIIGFNQALKYRSVTDIVRPIREIVRRREETTGHSVQPK